MLLLALLTCLGSSALGALVGKTRYYLREQELVAAVLAVHAAPGNAELLAEAERQAAQLFRSRTANLLLAEACLAAADSLPYRRRQLERALLFLRRGGGPDNSNLNDLLLAAGLFSNLGMETETAAVYARADALFAEAEKSGAEEFERANRENYLNDRAYFFAAAADPQLRDPVKALALAKRLMLEYAPGADDETPPPSAKPAYLDTLAAAYFANGKTAEALQAQRLALAAASTRGLDSYLATCAKYEAAANNSTSR